MMASPFVFSFSPPSSPNPTLYGDVINYARQVDSEIAALNTDMAAQQGASKVTLPADFIVARNAFCAEWIAFFSAYQEWGYLTQLPSGAWDQVAQYESKNEDWVKKFQDIGGKRSGAPPQDRPQGADVAGAVKWGAAAVIAAAAAYGIYEFVGKRRSN